MSRTRDLLSGFERQCITVDGIDSVVFSIGKGPELIFLHGGGTFMGFGWARDLASDFRLLLPHHPNFGESGDGDFGTTTDYARHYQRLIEVMGLERFHLAGASMGAAIAVELAVCEPSRIDSLALVTPAGLTSPTVPPPDFTGVAPEDVPSYFVHDRNFIEQFWPRDPTPEFSALLARERAAAAQLRDFSPEADARTRSLLTELHARTLLLWGKGDRVLRCGLLDEWRRELPTAEWELIENGAHMLLEEFPEARRAMHAFLINQS